MKRILTHEHNLAFHQGLHCLIGQNQSSEKEIQYYGGGGILTCDLSICTMDHSDFIVCSFMENYVGLKRVK